MSRVKIFKDSFEPFLDGVESQKISSRFLNFYQTSKNRGRSTMLMEPPQVTINFSNHIHFLSKTLCDDLNRFDEKSIK